MLFAMGLVIAGAWVTYGVIEKPSLAFLERRFLSRDRFAPLTVHDGAVTPPLTADKSQA